MIWKNVVGYEGKYKVSSIGEVYSYKNDIILKPYPNNDGYLRVDLYKNKKSHTKSVHRLIAIAFLNNYHNKPTVDHKNQIRNDNRLFNLRWATLEEQQANKSVMITNKLQEKYIGLTKYNKYSVRIRKLKIYKNFDSLDEAIDFRDFILD